MAIPTHERCWPVLKTVEVRKAASELLPLVYEELRRLAAHKLANEAPGQTLQATALVHEAWLRLISDDGQRFENRGHFFAAAAEAMRRILIERARRKSARRHCGLASRLARSSAALIKCYDRQHSTLWKQPTFT